MKARMTFRQLFVAALLPVSTVAVRGESCRDIETCEDCLATEDKACSWMACCIDYGRPQAGLSMTVSLNCFLPAEYAAATRCEGSLSNRSEEIEMEEGLHRCWGACHEVVSYSDEDQGSPDAALCAYQMDCESCTNTVLSNNNTCVWFSKKSDYVTAEFCGCGGFMLEGDLWISGVTTCVSAEEAGDELEVEEGTSGDIVSNETTSINGFAAESVAATTSASHNIWSTLLLSMVSSIGV